MKNHQIQELLEHLDDDYSDGPVNDNNQALPGKRRGQVTQTIREGQATFRKHLIDYYGCKCMMTGETLAEVIEAAHIHSYDGQHTNEVGNGMLLRSDIHKLFDRGLIAIEPGELVVHVADELKESGYADLEGQDLILDRLPVFKQGIFNARWEEFKNK